MDPAFFSGRFHGRSGRIDVGGHTTGQAADDRAADHSGDLLHGIKVALAGDGEAGLDDVNAQAGELACHLQLLAGSHGCTWALLPITESRVENQNAVTGHRTSLT